MKLSLETVRYNNSVRRDDCCKRFANAHAVLIAGQPIAAAIRNN